MMPEPVAQPLHGGAGDEDRAFQRVGALSRELVGNGGEQLVLRGDRRRAGVEQGKAAGAVGRLDHARLEAGLADGGGLLVAGDARDHDAAAEQFRHAVAEAVRRVLYLRQHRTRHAQDFQQLVIPLALVDVEQQRARGIGGIGGVRFAAGQPPQQIAIDGAEHQLAPLGAFAGAGHVIQDPRHLGAGEIGIDDQAGFGGDRRLVAFGFQFGADVGCAAVLPDDGAVHGLSRRAVPHHCGFALVGDADRGDVLCGDVGLLQRLAAGGNGRIPDVLRLMLDPAGCGKMLREFLLRRRRDRDVIAEHDRARGCGALIDGEDEGHGASSRVVSCVSRQGKRIGDGSSISAATLLLSLPLVGRVAHRERSERCDGWGACFHKGTLRALPCATPTRRFAPPSPQGGGIKATPTLWSRRRRPRWSGRS